MSASDSGPRLGTTEQEPVQDSVAQDSVAQLLADWARERPDLDFSPVGVINRLARVRAHIDSALLLIFRDFSLTAADFRVIVTLRRVGPPYELPQARLMTQLALTSGTISLRVDRLAKRGIVTREADPDDKRGQRVRLTAEGLRLFDKVAPLHLANEERLLSSLTHDERVTLARLLSKLLISFESGTVQAGLPLGMRLEPAHLARYRRTAAGLSDTPGMPQRGRASTGNRPGGPSRAPAAVRTPRQQPPPGHCDRTGATRVMMPSPAGTSLSWRMPTQSPRPPRSGYWPRRSGRTPHGPGAGRGGEPRHDRPPARSSAVARQDAGW